MRFASIIASLLIVSVVFYTSACLYDEPVLPGASTSDSVFTPQTSFSAVPVAIATYITTGSLSTASVVFAFTATPTVLSALCVLSGDHYGEYGGEIRLSTYVTNSQVSLGTRECDICVDYTWWLRGSEPGHRR